MSGQHGLEHVQRFATADFTHHNAVRSHSHCVPNEIPYSYLALTLDIGGTGLKPNEVAQANLKLCGILDGDHTFLVSDERRENVEGRRLSTSCATEKMVPGNLG